MLTWIMNFVKSFRSPSSAPVSFKELDGNVAVSASGGFGSYTFAHSICLGEAKVFTFDFQMNKTELLGLCDDICNYIRDKNDKPVIIERGEELLRLTPNALNSLLDLGFSRAKPIIFLFHPAVDSVLTENKDRFSNILIGGSEPSRNIFESDMSVINIGEFMTPQWKIDKLQTNKSELKLTKE